MPSFFKTVFTAYIPPYMLLTGTYKMYFRYSSWYCLLSTIIEALHLFLKSPLLFLNLPAIPFTLHVPQSYISGKYFQIMCLALL